MRLDTCKSVTMRLDTCKSVNQMFDKMSVCATTSHETSHMPRGVNKIGKTSKMVVARPRHKLRGLGFRV